MDLITFHISITYVLCHMERALGRPRYRWVDIRMDLGEVGWGDVD
jgi:hypothetical protein